MSNEQLTMNN